MDEIENWPADQGDISWDLPLYFIHPYGDDPHLSYHANETKKPSCNPVRRAFYFTFDPRVASFGAKQ